MNKKKKINWNWLWAFIAAGLAIWYFFLRTEKEPLQLQTERPVIGSLKNMVTATGTIQPVDTVAVGTQVSGTIRAVYADFNSTVHKGQLLAQLDKSLLDAQLSQYVANLAQAQANLTFQQSNYKRQQKLYEVGAVSQSELESARYNWQSAKDNVSSISAQVSSAKRNLSFTDIYSPIDGTVLSRSVSEGQTVAASFNTPTLFSIAKDLTKMQVQAAVDEADIGSVAKGQTVSFTVDAFPADTFGGMVKEIRLQSAVSSNVVTYTTIIEAPNEDGRLKPGMTATVIIYTKVLDNVLLVPSRALTFEPDEQLKKQYAIADVPVTKEKHIWVTQNNSLVMRRVKTGMTDDTHVQITSGLNNNDEVVTGYTTSANEQQKPQQTGSSPFLPKPPGGNRKTARQP